LAVRRIISLGALLALLVVGTGVALAAGGSATPKARGKVHVIHVQRDAGQDVFLDLDHSATAGKPAPDSIGDEDVFTAGFHRNGKDVGFDGGVCKLVRLPSWYHCVATNNFRRGALTTQFLADFASSEPGHFAITGGTGAYRGASGEVLYVGKEDGTADVTFTFTTR
jgi:hypothetical protein